MAKHDKSGIMKAAWAHYRHMRGNWPQMGYTFAQALKEIWRREKRKAADEEAHREQARVHAEWVAAMKAKEAARARAVAALSAEDRARLEALKKDLHAHQCKDLWDDSDRSYVWRLESEIAELEKEAAA